MRYLLSLVNRERLPRLLNYLLDESEFLSPHGVRSVSKYHQDHPYILNIDGVQRRVAYEPAESRTGMFGGNSNWRGPVWFPLNYLLIESLQKFHWYYGDATEVRNANGIGKTTYAVADCAGTVAENVAVVSAAGGWNSSCDGRPGSISQRSALAGFDFV